MPSEAQRLHPFGILSRALRLVRQLLLPAVLGGASIGDDLGGILFWVLLLLAVPSLLIGIAHWIAFRYRVEADDLIIDSGVLSRRRRVIPIDRIQNVDLEQSPLERLARVAELRIETASGGREAEATLSVLPLDQARAVQSDLLARRRRAREQAPGEQAQEPAAEPLLRLSTPDLALAGATSNEAGLIAAGLATLLEVAGRFGALAGIGEVVDDAVAAGAGAGAVGVVAALAIMVLAFFVLGWLVSIVATVVRFHGFTLTRHGDDLRREHGLFSRRHTTVPLARVQAVRVEQTLPRRALGLVALKIDTAGAGPHAGSGGRGEAHIPIARLPDLDRLLPSILADGAVDPRRLRPVAPASRRRETTRLSATALLVAAALWVSGIPRPWLALLLLPAAWLLARARYRSRGWELSRSHLLARDGVLTRTTWIVPERKIQTLHVTQTPFQRRWDLATLLVDTAAGTRAARVIDLTGPTAVALMDRLADRRADDPPHADPRAPGDPPHADRQAP